jgi:hypothetical protein
MPVFREVMFVRRNLRSAYREIPEGSQREISETPFGYTLFPLSKLALATGVLSSSRWQHADNVALLFTKFWYRK